MTALAFLVGVALLVIITLARCLGARSAAIAAAGLLEWLATVGTLSALDIVGNAASRPPGALYIVIRMVAFIGLSAPVVALLLWCGLLGRRTAITCNVLALLNIIARSALTAPGPLHRIDSEVPNPSIGSFPNTFIAGVFAPLAVLLHVLAIRSLCAQR